MHFNTYADMETAVANARFDATPISTDFLAAMMVAFERELETASDAAYDHGCGDGYSDGEYSGYEEGWQVGYDEARREMPKGA